MQQNVVELASLDGVSNHVYGSAESPLSKPSLVNGQWRLLVPDQPRALMARPDRYEPTAHRLLEELSAH